MTHRTRDHTVSGNPRNGREALCIVCGMTTRTDTRRENTEKSSQETTRGQRVGEKGTQYSEHPSVLPLSSGASGKGPRPYRREERVLLLNNAKASVA